MVKIIIADKDQHAPQLRELIGEYLGWVNLKLNEEFGLNFDVSEAVESNMADLGKFLPPTGRLLLSFAGEEASGIGCLKYLSPGVGEIKRMYVRPQYRRCGIGHALLERLFEQAIRSGYAWLRLDSTRFMSDAHRLYRSFGFHEIDNLVCQG